MSVPNPQVSGEVAAEILAARLTEAERAKVFEIFKDMSAQIRWGRVLSELFPTLLDSMQDVIFGMNDFKSNRYVKQDIWKVFQADASLFEDGDEKAMSRRHLLLLYLTKRLLGVLKTKVKQETAEVPVMGPQEESDLLEIVAMAQEKKEEQIQEEEEEHTMSREVEVAATLERELVNLAPAGDCRQNGKHARTVVRYRRNNEEIYSEQYCKDCRQMIKSTLARSAPAKSAVPCEHPGAAWVEGREGKEAICTKCKGPIPNPETYQWINAGLEPFGDDPAKDEVITLCSAC